MGGLARRLRAEEMDQPGLSPALHGRAENNLELARLLWQKARAEETPKPMRRLGTLRGSVLSMAPDFDAPLEDFREYNDLS